MIDLGRLALGCAPIAGLFEPVDEATACERRGVPPVAAAVAFPLRHQAVSTVVVGARTPAEVAASAGALRHAVPDELWAELA